MKIFSTSPDFFYIGFTGQTIIAIVQLFHISSSSRLAATWFGETEVSTACGLGVIGLQLGVAIGFVTTPLLVTDHDDLNLIGQDLSFLFWIIAICSTIATTLVFIFFDKEPKLPPSLAQALLRKTRGETKKRSDTIQSYKRLVHNGPFMSLLFTYGVNIGTYCYLSTLLNPIILAHFPVSSLMPDACLDL